MALHAWSMTWLMDLAPTEWMPMTPCAIWRGVTHVAADLITVIAMNALCSMISEYEINKAITNNAQKMTCRTARPGRKILGGCGAGIRTPAASNRASMSMAHITHAVPNILFNTNLPFTAIHTAGGSLRWSVLQMGTYSHIELTRSHTCTSRRYAKWPWLRIDCDSESLRALMTQLKHDYV